MAPTIHSPAPISAMATSLPSPKPKVAQGDARAGMQRGAVAADADGLGRAVVLAFRFRAHHQVEN
jgi:hypothetical protein